MKKAVKMSLLLFLTLSLGVLTGCPDSKPSRSGVSPTTDPVDVCEGLTGAERDRCIDDYIRSTSNQYGYYWKGVLSVKDAPLYRSYLRTLIQQPCDTGLSFSLPINYDKCDVWDERIGIMLWSTALDLNGEHFTSLWKLLDQSLSQLYSVAREFWVSDFNYQPILDNSQIGINDDKISVWIDTTNLVESNMDVTLRYQGKVLAQGRIYFQPLNY